VKMDLKSLQEAGFSGSRPQGTSDEQKQQQEAYEEQRTSILSSIMDSTARERLARVALVKPEVARSVEDHVIKLAKSGKLKEIVTENVVMKLLEDIGKLDGEAKGATKRIIIQRKKRMEDDFDDDDDDM
jgi:programmed cell death protein 5